MNKEKLDKIISWEDYKRNMLSEEERAELDLKVSLIGELIDARNEKGISQKELEELSGVKQPVIARIEKGQSIPNLNTLVKLLVPLGKTLTITSLPK